MNLIHIKYRQVLEALFQGAVEAAHVVDVVLSGHHLQPLSVVRFQVWVPKAYICFLLREIVKPK